MRVVDGGGSSVGEGGGERNDGDDVGVHFEVSELVTCKVDRKSVGVN